MRQREKKVKEHIQKRQINRREVAEKNKLLKKKEKAGRK